MLEWLAFRSARVGEADSGLGIDPSRHLGRRASRRQPALPLPVGDAAQEPRSAARSAQRAALKRDGSVTGSKIIYRQDLDAKTVKNIEVSMSEYTEAN